jgi:hypothetical protein
VKHGATLACYPGVPAASYGAQPHGTMALVELEPGREVRITEHRL